MLLLLFLLVRIFLVALKNLFFVFYQVNLLKVLLKHLK